MTDKEILDEVYRRLVWITDNWRHMNMDRMFDKVHDMKDFTEQEWQKEDEEELRKQYNRNRPVEEHIHYPESVPSFSKQWYKEDYPNGPITDGDKKLKEMLDVAEIERHRGLEIGPDGTVKD